MGTNKFTPPCRECGGSCCGYVALEIDPPNTKTACDNIRWYLLHKDVNVYRDHDNCWQIEFRTPCLRQQQDGSCGAYTERPRICRNYGNGEGECEYYDSPYSLFFNDAEQFEAWLDSRGFSWRFKR